MKKSMCYMCGMSQKIAYGYRRSAEDLAPLGAGKRVYIDDDRKRQARAEMFRALRPGDVVRVLYLRDLGGSPVADKLWQGRIEAKGAAVDVCTPEKPKKKMGRPKTFDPTPEQECLIRSVWLDEARSLADRLGGVKDIVGEKVNRFTLYRRYGNPGNPKN